MPRANRMSIDTNLISTEGILGIQKILENEVKISKDPKAAAMLINTENCFLKSVYNQRMK
jgi:hypothetical protein